MTIGARAGWLGPLPAPCSTLRVCAFAETLAAFHVGQCLRVGLAELLLKLDQGDVEGELLLALFGGFQLAFCLLLLWLCHRFFLSFYARRWAGLQETCNPPEAFFGRSFVKQNAVQLVLFGLTHALPFKPDYGFPVVQFPVCRVPWVGPVSTPSNIDLETLCDFKTYVSDSVPTELVALSGIRQFPSVYGVDHVDCAAVIMRALPSPFGGHPFSEFEQLFLLFKRPVGGVAEERNASPVEVVFQPPLKL